MCNKSANIPVLTYGNATYTILLYCISDSFTFIKRIHMRSLKPSFGLALILATSTAVNAQHIDSVLNVLATNYPAEKVYIHYDKDSYIAGETIWFKAYFSSDGLPSVLSTSFYVELSDSKGRVVSNKIYPVLGAAVRGNIELPDSLPQGNYYLKGSTPAIANYGNEFIYNKDIIVFNPTSKNV